MLINGKRRHTTALVHVNGTMGRGSTGADLNAIPVSAIERIEILRDGAAAQYGSDAIAGVINIVLKAGVAPGDGWTSRAATTATDQGVGDGHHLGRRASSTAGSPRASSSAAAGSSSTGEYRDRNRTNRAGPIRATRSGRATPGTTRCRSPTTGWAMPRPRTT